jgi:aldose sugar dehydrogenase
MKVKLYILFIIIAIVLLQQCAGLDSVSKITDSNLVQIYNTNCAGCHGRQLQHFKMLTTATKLTLEQLQHITQYGDSVKGMPAFGATINKAAIIKLSKYIKNYKYADNQVAAQKEAKDYSIEVVADNLEIPWGMEFLPNGGMLITEKKGRLLRRNINGDITAIKGLPPIRNAGQGGLLDVKLHPQYAQNGWVYISYSYIDSDNKSAGGTAILRAKIIGDSLTEQQEIFKAVPAVTTNHHFGCRMVFDEKGYLYFSVGERGKHFEFPQKTDNANGKIHRVYDDGTIPKDNPFVNTPNAIASIYSYGHRNPQGLAIHPQTGLVWEHEHGPKGGDEINLVKKGVNYGWPVISYGINYDGSILTKLKEKENMEQPLHYYVPSIAPSGMAFITGNIYPAWKNNLLIGSLSFHYLERLELNGTQVIHQEKMLAELDSRVRDVRIGPGGYIYVAVEGPGRILKLLPK